MEQLKLEGTENVEVLPIGKTEARELTDRIKDKSEELWYLLLEAYERGVHTTLGYSSWGSYFEAEFGGHQSRGYQLIDAGRVVRAIESHSTTVERPTERQARELAPIAKEDPERAVAIWNEVVAGSEAGAEVPAAEIRRAVRPDSVVQPNKFEVAEKKFSAIRQRLHELAAGIDMAGGLHQIVKRWPEQNQRIFVDEYRALAERVLKQVEEFEQSKGGDLNEF